MTDPSFQGIDPQLLSQLTSSLTKGAGTGLQLAGSYVGQFHQLGLDTGPILKLLSDYTWAQNQQGMLQRRYALASHQPSAQWVHGMATAGAGTLKYPTATAAKKAGDDEGKKLSALIAANDWSGVQAELKTLQGNDDDPDYMAALFKTLGPSAIYYLSAQYNGLKESGHKGEADELQNVIGQGLATASSEFPLTGKYLEGIQSRDPELDYYPGGDMQALATFLTVGTYSTQWLKTLTPYALEQAPAVGGDFPRPGTDQIFQAIANNPAYAAQLFKQEMNGPGADRFSQFLANPLYVAQISNQPGFAAFVKAATIPPKGATNTSLYSGNAKSLIEMFGEDPGDRTSSAVRKDMVGITTYYWNDLLASVNAAAPGADGNPKVGLGIPAQDWGYFVQEAMRDKDGSAQLMAFYAAWNKPLPAYTDAADSWKEASVYAVRDFMLYNYVQAGEQAGKGPDAIADVLGEAGAAAFGAIVFPEGEATAGVAELLTSALKESKQDAVKTMVSGYITNAVGSYLAPDGNINLPSGGTATSLAALWENQARAAWDNGTDGTSSAATRAAILKNSLHDPSWYAAKYGGSFISDGSPADGAPKGQLIPLATLRSTTSSGALAHPGALAAYNAWLQDPGVTKTIGPSTAGSAAAVTSLTWDNLNYTMGPAGADGGGGD